MNLRTSLLAVLFLANTALATEGYYRSPSLRGDLLVFTAEGDLWSHRLSSGETKRMTTHPALEIDAAISPNGDQVAFVADYEGVQEVYIMPISGGAPKRLTYENTRIFVQSWTPDNQVLYSTRSRVAAPYNMTLKTVIPSTLQTDFIPLADAMSGAIDAESENIYFTQFGLLGDNASTYRGGMAGKLWQYQLNSDNEAVRMLSDHPGSVRRPMLQDKQLYFISDASGRDNIWSVDLNGGNVAQITHHDDFSVRHASIDDGRIVYQLGADLLLLDLSSQESMKLNIDLTSDHPGMRELWINEPMKFLTSIRLAGNQDKVAITARGKIAIAGTGKARLVTVGTPTRSRMRNAVLSRDKKWVYTVSDTNGELEIWRYAADGGLQSEQMTFDGNSLRRKLFESPDGNWIAHDDGRGGLWVLNTETKENNQIVSDGGAGFTFDQVEWSPDSALLAIAYTGKDSFRSRIMLHELKSATQTFLSSNKYESGVPQFGRNGQWLYFLSNRNFDAAGSSVWADRDFGPAFKNRTGVYAVALTKDAKFPFQAANELSVVADADEEAEDSKKPKITVEWSDLSNRIWQVPVKAGAYENIAVNDKFLYLLSSSDKPKIEVLKMEANAELKAFTKDAVSMQLSDDGKKLLVVKKTGENHQSFIVPAKEKFPDDVSKNTVQTTGWQFSVDPKIEREQFFYDAWLMHREMFYDPEMRGVDWDAMKTKYTPLLERVTDRRELNDVLAQMMGELNAMHSAVRGGDLPSDPTKPKPSVLGAELRQVKSGIEIHHIYHHEIELPAQAPPLAKPGVDAANGDIITAINGVAVNSLEDVHRALRNQADKQVLLDLKRGSDSVRTIVVPVGNNQDRQFRYRDWVNNNRLKTEAADPDIGYLHIQNMGPADVASFARDFYSISKRKGIVIDVRRNGGGNVDSWIIDRLLRKAWMFWEYRDNAPYFNMQNTFRGHLAVIADEITYSDGETFTAAIKHLNIAPVIGKRTAGAGVWLSGGNRVSDSGIARVAEFAAYSMDGLWLVEGYGVSPTIEVENLPHATYLGSDSQLDAAIDYLQQKIEKEPVPEVKAKPFPPYPLPAQEVSN